MIAWINRTFDTHYTENELNDIKDFTLLWNIYENILFEASFSVEKLDRIVRQGNYSIQDFEECYNYFHDRYTENQNLTYRFNALNFRSNDKKPFVERILLQTSSTNIEKIITIGIIVYRLRCNLFHGIKDYRQLDGQATNFANANTFIQRILTQSTYI